MTDERPAGVGGGVYATPTDPIDQSMTNRVLVRRLLPGQIPPEAHVLAFERLTEAIILTCTANRSAAEPFIRTLQIAIMAAPLGGASAGVEKVLQTMKKRLETHLATLPNAAPPPPSAA